MNIVTGAFGYIGKYITRELLENGEQVKTITTHPNKPNPFGEAVQAYAYNFDHPDELTSVLQGVDVLYNTYWIRFEYGGATYEQAVKNTATLFQCARAAGVGKIVHISVTQASVDSSIPYYRGKGLQERALIESGVPYAILRPTLVFGVEDILVNNIAWLIRNFPVFPIFGSGDYQIQPVFVRDLAEIALGSARRPDSLILDAIGPEIFTFKELVQCMASVIKPSLKLIHLAPGLGIFLGNLIGLITRDVLLTRDELRILMDELLVSQQAPNGPTRFSEWLVANHASVGVGYTSEVDRHFKWTPPGSPA